MAPKEPVNAPLTFNIPWLVAKARNRRSNFAKRMMYFQYLVDLLLYKRREPRPRMSALERGK